MFVFVFTRMYWALIGRIPKLKNDHDQINYLPTEVWNMATLIDVIK